MAHFNTHIALASCFKDKFDEKYLYSGAVLPDISLYSPFPFKKEKLFTYYWHFPEPESPNGIEFAKKILNKSKSIEEKSFSFGLLSHFILDKYFHSLIMNKYKLSNEEHIRYEFIYASKHLYNKIFYLRIPKEILINNIPEKYKEQIKYINVYRVIRYSFIANIGIKSFIKNVYLKKRFNFAYKIAFLPVRKSYLKNYNFDIFKIFNTKADKKILKDFDNAFEKAKKELQVYADKISI